MSALVGQGKAPIDRQLKVRRFLAQQGTRHICVGVHGRKSGWSSLPKCVDRHKTRSEPESIETVRGNMQTVRFTLEAFADRETTAQREREGGRKYRRTKGMKGPRLYRTRPDPVADVWDEVEQELTRHPERTAKAAFEHLQERYPGVFPATQVRTLQRRVQEWRKRTLLAFDDEWLREELLVRRSYPLPLRAIVAGRAEGRNGTISDEATAAAG